MPHEESGRSGIGPRGRSRAIARAAVLAFVLAQVLVPLAYYAGGDRHDERFAWRMFSAVRVEPCHVIATDLVRDGGSVETRRVDLLRTVHVGWKEQLDRDRARVVRAFLARRCDEAGVVRARLERVCRASDGTTRPDRSYERTCASGALRTEEARR